MEEEADESGEARGHEQLCGSAASGQSPPAGPQWKKEGGSKPLAHVATTATVFSGALCAAKDGFTLHAASCAGAEDDGGRERLLRYVLRPAVARERIHETEEGSQLYRRAELLLSEGTTARPRAKSTVDVLDTTIRTKQSLDEVLASGSRISQRRNVATTLTPDDFAQALRAARGVD